MLEACAKNPAASGPEGDPDQEGGVVPDRDGPSRLEAAARAHYRDIWRLLRHLGLPVAGLEDAVQQVFLVAARRLGEVRPESERAYLVSVAVRTAANLRRSQRAERSREGDADPDSFTGDAPGADELVDRIRFRRLLDEVLDSLPEDLRVPFVLFELEGLTLDEMALVLGTPRGTAASRLRRAREAFRRGLARKRPTAASWWAPHPARRGDP